MIDARRRLRGGLQRRRCCWEEWFRQTDGGCGGRAEGVFKDGGWFGLGEGERNQKRASDFFSPLYKKRASDLGAPPDLADRNLVRFGAAPGFRLYFRGRPLGFLVGPVLFLNEEYLFYHIF